MKAKPIPNQTSQKGTMKILDPEQLRFVKGGDGDGPMPPRSRQIRKK